MQRKSPRILSIANIAAVCFFALSGCEKTVTTPVDPKVGRECFEMHRAMLPPGSQYEGAEALPDGIRVKVMDGVGIVALECKYKPDGTLDLTETAR